MAKVFEALAPTGALVSAVTTITDRQRLAVTVTADERDSLDPVRALIDAGVNPTLVSMQDGGLIGAALHLSG
jgi:hypothetical protein